MIVSAALVLVFVAVMHSWLGETRILAPLLALPREGVLKSARARGILRGAWHITSFAWVALAALLALAIGSPLEAAAVWTVLALSVATAAACLASYGPMHPGFLAFTVCAGLLAAQRLA